MDKGPACTVSVAGPIFFDFNPRREGRGLEKGLFFGRGQAGRRLNACSNYDVPHTIFNTVFSFKKVRIPLNVPNNHGSGPA